MNGTARALWVVWVWVVWGMGCVDPSLASPNQIVCCGNGISMPRSSKTFFKTPL